MKSVAMIFLVLVPFIIAYAQENEPEPALEMEEQIENLVQTNEAETEDDSYSQLLQYYRKNPLNLNLATPDDLQEFRILSDLQVQNFFIYQRLFGPLVHIYELQAIPSWNISDIRKLVPYVVVSDTKTIFQSFRERLSAGDNSLLLRYAMVLPKSKGYINKDSSASRYAGSRPHLLFRYKHNYKNLLQYGLLGDKDSGEQFLKGSQKTGFDFYSFHLFTRKIGFIKALALGDFTVNLGQGLTHWQSLAFKKSAAIVFSKRQSDVLRPYTSSGEYNFHRGVGISLSRKNWEATLFASLRKFDATVTKDSVQDFEGSISSILKSGYHRTLSEVKTRNNLGIFTIGSNIKYKLSRLYLGLSGVQYFFSRDFQKSDKPYDLFAIEGDRWTNLSMDYSYSFRNVHVFGELATDRKKSLALIHGMIASLDKTVDLSIVLRKIGKEYQSVWGNAFTENVLPSNETGLYTGISIAPGKNWRIDAYFDLYKFPWLLFLADAPSHGSEYLVRVTYTPNKQTSVTLRYKREGKQTNSDAGRSTSAIVINPRRNMRYHLSHQINRELSVTNRFEALWSGKGGAEMFNGFLVFADFRYKPFSKPYAVNTRLQYFETDGYAARIYAYERDVLFSYSIPAFFEKGFRWYINLRTDVSKLNFLISPLKAELWIKYGLTYYFELDKIGSELDEIQGKKRSEIKIQLLLAR